MEWFCRFIGVTYIVKFISELACNFIQNTSPRMTRLNWARFSSCENSDQKKIHTSRGYYLTLSWRRSVSYKNQSIDLLYILVNWFLYDRDLRHERVNALY